MECAGTSTAGGLNDGIGTDGTAGPAPGTWVGPGTGGGARVLLTATAGRCGVGTAHETGDGTAGAATGGVDGVARGGEMDTDGTAKVPDEVRGVVATGTACGA